MVSSLRSVLRSTGRTSATLLTFLLGIIAGGIPAPDEPRDQRDQDDHRRPTWSGPGAAP